jgi:general stress protein YciG
MSGIKAATTNKLRYDSIADHPNGFYGRIGKMGGRISRGGGFQTGAQATRDAGRKGGIASGKARRLK